MSIHHAEKRFLSRARKKTDLTFFWVASCRPRPNRGGGGGTGIIEIRIQFSFLLHFLSCYTAGWVAIWPLATKKKKGERRRRNGRMGRMVITCLGEGEEEKEEKIGQRDTYKTRSFPPEPHVYPHYKKEKHGLTNREGRKGMIYL